MHEDIGLNFAAALRSFLRQDPDIIMVGEIRDFETAEIGVKAALTGHLVLSTLHTNDAPATVSRLLNMGIEPFLVTASRERHRGAAALPQALPRLQEAGRARAAGAPRRWLPAETRSARSRLIDKGDGCKTCNDRGFKGRIAVYEVMPLWDGLKELVHPGRVHRRAEAGGDPRSASRRCA